MNKRIFKFLLLATVTMTACKKDFLDRYPLDAISDANYWQTEDQVRLAVNGCYAQVKGKGMIDYENMSDNTIFPQATDYTRISTGNFGDDLGTINSEWGGLYDAVRRCNHFLENFRKATFVNEATRNQYEGEVRFMRAYAYTFLTTFFGDVPLITQTLNVGDPELYAGRDPRQTVVNWIYAELDSAAAKLPVSYPPSDLGRITKGAALAWKSRVAIWNNQWDIAEAAAKAVMDLGIYHLYSNGNPQTSYYELFTYKGQASVNANNKETIFARIYTLTTSAPHNLSREIQLPNAVTRWSPTKSLVDAYLCSDGRPISQSPLYHENSYNDYFVNRDPRMTQTILAPGSPWKGNDDGDPDNLPNTVYNLPKFVSDNTGCVTLTGFYFTKWAEPSAVQLVSQDENDIILLRYAEVLLNYAEARERQGKLTQDDLDASINLLRARVGMHPMILSELADWGLDVRTEIQRERRVELAMEGLRYFDIIRWKQGAALAEDLKGMKRDFAPDPSQVANVPVDSDGYIIVSSGRTFTDPKNYLWPVPLIQRQRNPNLGNNPGW
ncbi:MAG TPA: RagB/SusD family nutrient uptake outer membrane protein [Chitinophagaceae bacterium]|nr:RagB/SusD family nutrient uptake outer membrane protein [Chitinophagaceae bacterium]